MELCALHIKEIMMELGCQILPEIVDECNTMLEDSSKRRAHCQIKDRCEKQMLSVCFQWLCFL